MRPRYAVRAVGCGLLAWLLLRSLTSAPGWFSALAFAAVAVVTLLASMHLGEASGRRRRADP